MRITRDEFGRLTAIRSICELDMRQPEVVAEAHAEDWAGVGRNAGHSAWPDWIVLKQLREQVANKSSCYSGLYPDIGEEDISGVTYTGEKPSGRQLTDLSYIGRASLLGKVAGEIARRLQLELEQDRMAEHRRWTPPEDLP